MLAGVIDPHAWALLAAYEFTGVAVFYGLLRSGRSERLRDPGMALAQTLFALSAVTLAYALIEPGRGAALQLLCLVLVVGMLRLTPRQLLVCAALACAMLGSTVLTLWQTRAGDFEPRREALNLALAAIVLPTLAYIGHQVGVLRQRQVAQGQELAETLQRLEDLATRDALTGLMNRRHMQQKLNEALKWRARGGQAFSVALLDVDHFKRVNDRWGHAAGDAVLTGLGQAAAAVLRRPDVLARWGGEEFLLLLPHASAAAAERPLQRLREQLARHDWVGVLPEGEGITVSIGLAEHADGESLPRLLARADAALYAAKAAGRDRLVRAEPA